MTNNASTLLDVAALQVLYPIRGGLFGRPVGHVRAVEDVSIRIDAGETFGLAGESGCGKTTVGLAILQMVKPTGGRVAFEGTELTSLGKEDLRQIRRHMQIVFQDPYSSLNPRLTVGESIGEPLLVHGVARGRELKRKVGDLMETVGLLPSQASRYPHEFSGGQRQRIVIARALALRPKLIVCDEPVSALDVSVQSHILNLLNDLQQEFGLAYLFISHDLSVLKNVSDRVGIMYLGRLVELAETAALFEQPLHPYTEALMSAIPLPDPVAQRARTHVILSGEIPSPSNPPTGCPFHTRCPIVQAVCREILPPLEEKRPSHFTACHFRD
ncbi:MAG: ABC transporter ATP-binding protein [Alphaproteobacteria bacterium]